MTGLIGFTIFIYAVGVLTVFGYGIVEYTTPDSERHRQAAARRILFGCWLWPVAALGWFMRVINDAKGGKQ